MVTSSNSPTIYIGVESGTNNTVSSWNLNGTLNWGYIISSNVLYDMALSHDESFLTFVSGTSNVYLMNISSKSLTQYSTGIS